jgi:uncharacterized protein (TIGR02646 family)
VIRAIRDRVDPDTGVAISPTQTWLDKAKVATAKALTEGAAHKADDAVYGALEVRIVLEKLCEQKCAYCESKIGINADWDVEHYRPKGRVSENAAHPGYYWLAYAWNNLLPCCTFCNQRRFDRASLTQAGGPAAGKLDQFPLENEQDRCMNHNGDLSQERPWLLNPCLDAPEDHLSFAPDGSAINKTERGQKTIEICHLDRKRLRDERLAKLNSVKQLVEILQKAEAMADQALQELAQRALETARNSKAPFAGVARAVLANPQLFV